MLTVRHAMDDIAIKRELCGSVCYRQGLPLREITHVPNILHRFEHASTATLWSRHTLVLISPMQLAHM